MSTYEKAIEGDVEEREDESSMSFLDHLDELRSRLVRVALFVLIAFIVSFYFSEEIFNFLQVPVHAAMVKAKLGTVQKLPNVALESLADQADGTELAFSLPKEVNIGNIIVGQGQVLPVKVQRDEGGALQLVTVKPWLIGNQILPAGYILPSDLYAATMYVGSDNQLTTTTVQGAFNLYMKVSFFAAIFFGVPFILIQSWGFIAPGLYPHEKRYAAPLIIMASVCFIGGCAFAYYIAFPRAADFLLGVATEGNLRPLVTADEYFDLILIITLGLGVVFEIPAIIFFLSRMGLVTYKMLLKVWRISLIVIFIIAAILSPTTDVMNLMVFAAPMMLLYVVSIGIAWLFHKERHAE